MRKPFICTSLNDCPPGNPHCLRCSHAIYRGQALVSGQLYKWEFAPMWGPRFWRRGEYDWSPHPRHPVWDAVGRWCERLERQGKDQVTK